MSKLKVACFSISLDGYGAGPNQSEMNPLGVGGTELHDWFRPTRTFQKMIGQGEGVAGLDDDFAVRGFQNIGSWILGRNMFGPVRGPWPNLIWKGWWGENPPYHTPVFVLTHHPRAPLTMEGGTTFHFVTEGIAEALKLAKIAANGKDIRLGGGVSTIKHYVKAGLLDELHLVYSPILLGTGESLFFGLDWLALGYRCVEHARSEKATHIVLQRV